MTAALDRLYENTQNLLETIYEEEVEKGFTANLKAKINSTFAVRMYHTRTVVLNRLSCFPSVDIAPINEAFEEMEDEFALKVETFGAEEKHPELLTSIVGKGSGKIIEILLSHEQKLAGLGRSRFGFRKRK